MTPRLHLALAILVAAVLPAGSLIHGSGLLAYRMYAASPSCRLRIVAWDKHGTARPVSATALAARARGMLGDSLVGADRWQYLAASRYLSVHVNNLAGLACASVQGAAQVEVAVDRRGSLDAPIETSDALRQCP